MSASRHALAEPITPVAVGVAIYKTHASPFWQARIRNPSLRRYIVRSTKEVSKLQARAVALELHRDFILNAPPSVPREYLFKTYAHRFVQKARAKADAGELNANYVRTQCVLLDNKDWGLLKTFPDRDVRTLTTRDYNLFMESLPSSFKASTRNSIRAAFRNVMKVALADNAIASVPDTPAVPRKDEPRPMFWFSPLVEECEYKKLLWHAKQAAMNKEVSESTNDRRTIITQELGDLITFTTASFVRPIQTELFALRHRDIAIANNPPRLILTIKDDSKTGYRLAQSLAKGVPAYMRQRERNPNWTPDDYVWFPQHKTRQAAADVVGDQFNHILKRAKLKICPKTGEKRTLYSLRHTALCMRLWDGANIYALAKNAGTSVEMIQRFYAKHLPLSPSLVEDIHGDTTIQDKEEAEPKFFPWPRHVAALQLTRFLQVQDDPVEKARYFRETEAIRKAGGTGPNGAETIAKNIELYLRKEIGDAPLVTINWRD